MFHFFMATKVYVLFGLQLFRRGGIKKGVLLGFWYGHKLNDHDCFLSHGTNKQIFYKIYQTLEEIDEKPIKKLLKEAIKLDSTFKKSILSLLLPIIFQSSKISGNVQQVVSLPVLQELLELKFSVSLNHYLAAMLYRVPLRISSGFLRNRTDSILCD